MRTGVAEVYDLSTRDRARTHLRHSRAVDNAVTCRELVASRICRDSILAWRRVSSITHNQDEQQWWDFFAYNLGTDADWPAYVPR